jgi:hypothetical protein
VTEAAQAYTQAVAAIGQASQTGIEATIRRNADAAAKALEDTRRAADAELTGFASIAGRQLGLSRSRETVLRDAAQAARQITDAQARADAEARDRDARERAKAAEEADRTEAERQRRSLERERANRLSGVERTYAEQKIAEDDLNRERAEARSAEVRALIDDRIFVVRQEFAARRQAIIDEEAAKRTEADRAAAALKKASEDAARAYGDALRDILREVGQDNTRFIDEQNKRLESTTRAIYDVVRTRLDNQSSGRIG